MSREATLLLLVGTALLQACGPSWVPVADGPASRTYESTADGYYQVRRGDSLHAIAFNYALDWRDLAEWNGIRAPYTIYPEQQLRLSPAGPRQASSPGEVVTRPAPQPAGAVSRDTATGGDTPDKDAGLRSVQESPASATPAGQPAPPPAAEPVTEPAGTPPPQPGPARAVPPGDPDRWQWPVEGRILSTFQANDPARNGIDIGGEEGQAVRAAAAGEVVYSGSGLIGYGELIIIKHSDRMLSAYAHNRRRLVAEGQWVAAGEHLAEMGRNDRNQPMLHFEIRVNGTPQDPLRYLPRR